ncbi:MAG: hypothetical protein KAI91_03955, partial [Candidatus Omnitrophica bacterium]|nr:hypothetical protein [Candidatus Omnitrophota bacterium]
QTKHLNLKEQIDFIKAMCTGYLTQLSEEKMIGSEGQEINHVIEVINKAKNVLEVKEIFEDFVKQKTGAHIWLFDTDFTLIFHNEEINAKEAFKKVLQILKSKGYSFENEPYFASFGDNFIKISLYNKAVEVKEWINNVQGEGIIVGIGDSTLDDFLGKIIEKFYLPFYLGKGKDMAEYPSVLVLRDREGRDNVGYSATGIILESLLTARRDRLSYPELLSALEDLSENLVVINECLDGGRTQRFVWESTADFITAIQKQREICIGKILSSINYNGSMSVSSSSGEKYSYLGFHWIRDSGIVIAEVIRLYIETGDFIFKAIIAAFIKFTKIIQKAKSKFGMGAARFKAKNGESEDPDSKWAGPQNDGPALRAMALIRYALGLVEQGNIKDIEEAQAVYLVIKEDLDYLAEHWQDRCYDLWEDLMGYHFWTRMVQRRALLKGAALAEVLAEQLADDLKKDDAKRWDKIARNLEGKIGEHYDSLKRYIVSTLNWGKEKLNKTVHLDSSVIGAIVKTVDFEDPFMGVDDYRVMMTVLKLEKVFSKLYPINKKWIEEGKLGMGIGRYPEDTYDGVDQEGGNPWFVNTGWFAQYYSLLALKFIELREIEITSDNICFFRNIGFFQDIEVENFSNITVIEGEDRFNEIIEQLSNISQGYLEWMLTYISKEESSSKSLTLDGSMSEQVHRKTGKFQGPEDLTWSYLEFIRAVDLYEELAGVLEERRINVSR